MNDNPCYKCAERCVNCHSNCLKYIDWKQKHEVMRIKYQKENKINYGINKLNLNFKNKRK